MGSWLLGAWPATLALLVFIYVGHGAELRDAAWEAEGDPRKGEVASLRLSRTTQRSKPTFYRTGSLSALSRGLMTNLSVVEEVPEEVEDAQRRERQASLIRDPCWGCCVTRFPNHTGSREPARGDAGRPGTTPPPKPPKRNTTKGYHRPGAYTPMGKLRPEGRQAGSSPEIKGSGRQEANATERCRGCCGANGPADGRPLGRGEEGRGSQTSQGHSGERPQRPVSDREVPADRPAQKGENGWSSFSRGVHEPRGQPHRGGP
uniref:Uncharacterized protein isoform X1 n=1 Tax=Pogona vitticeps TaxID=103695 RepID=A0A6J0U9T4_9SAUR